MPKVGLSARVVAIEKLTMYFDEFRFVRNPLSESRKTSLQEFLVKLFSIGGFGRCRRDLIVQGRQHPFAISSDVDMCEVERPAEPRFWIGYKRMRSRSRPGSL